MGTIEVIDPTKHMKNENNRRAQRVGRRIITAAMKYVSDELESAQKEVVAKLSDKDLMEQNNQDKLETLIQQDDMVMFWSEALKRLVGQSNSIESGWRVFLLDSPVPNAFVSEMFPGRIFITTSMLDKYVDNDDELGIIFGHEISHLIHGHNTQANASSLILRSIEMTIIALDPFDGK